MQQFIPIDLTNIKTNMTKEIVFTDWDGTVTLQDSNIYMTDHLGFGKEERERVIKMMIDRKLSDREGLDRLLKSISDNGHNLDDCIDLLLKNIKLDPGFENFLKWCKISNIPLYVISSGMQPVISALLKKLIGPELGGYVKVIANDVSYGKGNTWRIRYRDNSVYGHDKSLSIEKILSQYKDHRPRAFYCGDGVSDLAVSRKCDILFARKGYALSKFCDQNSIPYNGFSTFDDVEKEIRQMCI